MIDLSALRCTGVYSRTGNGKIAGNQCQARAYGKYLVNGELVLLCKGHGVASGAEMISLPGGTPLATANQRRAVKRVLWSKHRKGKVWATWR